MKTHKTIVIILILLLLGYYHYNYSNNQEYIKTGNLTYAYYNYTNNMVKYEDSGIPIYSKNNDKKISIFKD